MPEFSETRQPAKRRGKSFKTLALESIREHALLEVGEGASKEVVEKAYIKHFMTRAFNGDDPASGSLLNESFKRFYPALKPQSEPIKFDFPVKGTATEKAEAILKAESDGEISIEAAGQLIAHLKDVSVIEMNTDIKERIEAIERALDERTS